MQPARLVPALAALSAISVMGAMGSIAIAQASQASDAPAAKGEAETRNVEFRDRNGERVGSAKLIETPNGILVDATLDGLEPGWHAFHIHERGKCEAPEFKSAGGHYAPRDHKHGFKVDGGPHAGDLQNVHVGDDGRLRVQALAANLALRGGDAALLDGDGSALMVHSGKDDYRSQPSGAAGKRVACAKIK